MLVQMQHIHKSYGERTVLSDVNLTIEDHDRLGLIGDNGCGKTTLLRILTERELPDRRLETDGIVTRTAKTSIGYLEQMGGLQSKNTVREEMRLVFAPLLEAQQKMHEMEAAMQRGETVDHAAYTNLQTFFESGDGYRIDVKIERILRGMGFPPELYTRPIESFSGGEKTRLAIAKLLLEEPNLLILDEPTNHLDFKTVMWLEEYLSGYRGALLLVSHDRYFLDRLCTGICEIERGTLTRYKGNYTAFTKQKEAAVARQWKLYEIRQKEIEKREDYVARNGVRASTAKQAQSRAKQLEKIERIEKPVTIQKPARITFTYPADPPEEVLQLSNVTLAVGAGDTAKTLARDITFTVRRGEKWGIIGDNGVGKSTLLKAILRRIPYEGKIRLAGGVKVSFFEQESTNLHPDKTVFDEIHDRVPAWNQYDVRSLLAGVRITGEAVEKQIRVLSGGERAKVCFAVMMLEHGNLLILDEPTNHLDISMKDVIEAALVDFPGTVIFVSHDRYLLDAVADHLLVLQDGTAIPRQGNFSDWIAQQQSAPTPTPAPEKPTPKRENNAKQERVRKAAIRAKIHTYGQALDEMQAELDTLEAEISAGANGGNYLDLDEKCRRMDTLHADMERVMEDMIAAEDELAGGDQP